MESSSERPYPPPAYSLPYPDHLRPIAITRRQRLKYWPGVPTLYEQGFRVLDLIGGLVVVGSRLQAKLD